MAITTDWTLEQFLRLPETKPALEFECGRITQKVTPTTEHALLQVRIARLFDDLQLARAFTELRTVLPTASKVPDVAFFVTAECRPVRPDAGCATRNGRLRSLSRSQVRTRPEGAAR
jgi:Uma2 family endonuclease